MTLVKPLMISLATGKDSMMNSLNGELYSKLKLNKNPFSMNTYDPSFSAVGIKMYIYLILGDAL